LQDYQVKKVEKDSYKKEQEEKEKEYKIKERKKFLKE